MTRWKLPCSVFLLCWIATAGAAARPARAEAASFGLPTVDINFFYEALAPYGDWLESPRYGWVWWPDVAISWRPYSEGYWTPSAVGWMWIDDEPWGWATFHYGRWFLDDDYGWLWVPGEDWAPAWVSWQVGEGWIGWAALPPEARFSWSDGLAPTREFRAVIDPAAYVFVDQRNFLRSHVVWVAEPAARNLTLLRRTRNETRYRVDPSGWIVDESLPFETVRRAVGAPVLRRRVIDTGPGGDRRAPRLVGDRVEVFRPAVRRVPGARPAPAERSLESSGRLQQRLARDQRERVTLEQRLATDRELLLQRQRQHGLSADQRREELRELVRQQVRQRRLLSARHDRLTGARPRRPGP